MIGLRLPARSRRVSSSGALVCLALTAPHGGAAPYRLDPTHSFVHAEFDHFGTTTTRLRIGPIDGEVDFDRDAQRGSLSVRIATTRVTSGVPPLDVRLRERDLLATDEFPEAFFVADRFAFDGTRLREVRGEFTLRGTSRPLALRAVRFNCYPSPIFKREVCGGDFEAEILRSEYGMTHLLPFVGDRVRLLITVEAVAR